MRSPLCVCLRHDRPVSIVHVWARRGRTVQHQRTWMWNPAWPVMECLASVSPLRRFCWLCVRAEPLDASLNHKSSSKWAGKIRRYTYYPASEAKSCLNLSLGWTDVKCVWQILQPLFISLLETPFIHISTLNAKVLPWMDMICVKICIGTWVTDPWKQTPVSKYGWIKCQRINLSEQKITRRLCSGVSFITVIKIEFFNITLVKVF